jgi:hypothetical protein
MALLARAGLSLAASPAIAAGPGPSLTTARVRGPTARATRAGETCTARAAIA